MFDKIVVFIFIKTIYIQLYLQYRKKYSLIDCHDNKGNQNCLKVIN